VAFDYGYSGCNRLYASSEDVVRDTRTRFWAYEDEIMLPLEPRGGHVDIKGLDA